MTTSNLSRTSPLVAVPSLPPSHSLVSMALHRVKTLLRHALEGQEPAEQTSDWLSVVPTWFSWKSIYAPPQDWDGYR
jgi:hypothetical protein